MAPKTSSFRVRSTAEFGETVILGHAPEGGFVFDFGDELYPPASFETEADACQALDQWAEKYGNETIRLNAVIEPIRPEVIAYIERQDGDVYGIGELADARGFCPVIFAEKGVVPVHAKTVDTIEEARKERAAIFAFFETPAGMTDVVDEALRIAEASEYNDAASARRALDEIAELCRKPEPKKEEARPESRFKVGDFVFCFFTGANEQVVGVHWVGDRFQDPAHYYVNVAGYSNRESGYGEPRDDVETYRAEQVGPHTWKRVLVEDEPVQELSVAKDATTEVTIDQLTIGSRGLLLALWEDAPNWSGTPLFDGDAALNGNLTDLKKKGFVHSFEPEDDGNVFVSFTPEGCAALEAHTGYDRDGIEVSPNQEGA